MESEFWRKSQVDRRLQMYRLLPSDLRLLSAVFVEVSSAMRWESAVLMKAAPAVSSASQASQALWVFLGDRRPLTYLLLLFSFCRELLEFSSLVSLGPSSPVFWGSFYQVSPAPLSCLVSPAPLSCLVSPAPLSCPVLLVPSYQVSVVPW